MTRWLRDNGLSSALFVLFAVTVIGHAWACWIANNEDLVRDHAAPLSLLASLGGGAFNSTLFENWERESCRCGPTSC
jgi:hypothetical protein